MSEQVELGDLKIENSKNELMIQDDQRINEGFSVKSLSKKVNSYLAQSKPTTIANLEKPRDKKNYQSFLISFGRRCFTFLPLLVAMLNTLTKVVGMAAKLSSKTPGAPKFQYKQVMMFSTCSMSDLFSGTNACQSTVSPYSMALYCDTSSIEYVTLQCKYTDNAAFKGFIGLWCALFSVYILYMFCMTASYSTWDLRFYIAEQHYKMSAISTVWKILAVLLTLASAGYSFFSVYTQDQSYANSSNDAELILSTILFIIFNFAAISTFCRINPSLLGIIDHPMSKFPDPIPINHIKPPAFTNGYGAVVNGNDVFTILELAIARSFVENNGDVGIAKYGDREKIINAFKTMELM